jgi:hypothetical protein
LLETAGVESASVTSVANQRSAAPHAHRAIAAHRCNPFSHPFDPFNSYFQSSYRSALLAPSPERQLPPGLARTTCETLDEMRIENGLNRDEPLPVQRCCSQVTVT